MSQRTEGDLLFETYLRHEGITVPEHEPDLGIGVRIEYLLDVDGNTCATEVKQFDPSSWPIKRGVTPMDQVLKPHRTQIHAAARKLREAKDLGHPLVVVLTDPKNALFGLLRPLEIMSAMMGDLQVRVPVSGGGPVGGAGWVAGRNGELRNDHPYISAVTYIDHSAEHPRARTFITNSPAAVPLSPVFFRGAEDLVWEHSDEASSYVPVHDGTG
jgi:hypothetical protein